MITIKIDNSGFPKTKRFMNLISARAKQYNLDKYGREGVEALEKYTPKDTGLTSRSWRYEITQDSNGSVISFYNDNVQNGIRIAIILQYGHATKNGYWVEGRDYINPAIQEVFENLANEAWEVISRV